MEYLLDIKDLELEQQINQLSQLEKECSPKNYDAFFSLNYELAELRYKFSEAKDTSTQAGTNDALNLLNLAIITLTKADDIQRTDDRVYEHEKDEQIRKLKEDLENQSFKLSADLGLLKSQDLIDQGDKVIQCYDGTERGGRLSKHSEQTYLRANDELVRAL